MKKIKKLHWILFLFIFLFAGITIIALVIREQQTDRINTALQILQNSNQPIQQVEATFGLLLQSENEFREYTLTYNLNNLANYKKGIIQLKANIDTLLQLSLAINNQKDEKTLQKTLFARNKETSKYLRLNKLTDSLMVVLSYIDPQKINNTEDKILLKAFTLKDAQLNIDTIGISTVTQTQKKGLFGKLKSFLVGEKETQVKNSKVIVKPNKTTKTDSLTSTNIHQMAKLIVDKGNKFYQNQIKDMINKRIEQRNSELKLTHLNNSLMLEIKSLLDDLQVTFTDNDAHARNYSTTTIYKSSAFLHNLLLIAIIAIFLLALMVTYMLRKKSIDNEIIKAAKDKAIREASEKSKFLAYMSHEFRCPVSLVLGYTEQLEQTALSAEQHKYLTNLKSSSEILLSTVNDILDLSTLNAGQMSLLSEPFNVEDALKKSISTFEQQAHEKDLSLQYIPIDNPVSVTGDEIRLRQIVNNLISNAIKYTKQGGITITASLSSDKGKVIFDLNVKDTGIGIPEDKLGQVFDEYQRVHDSSSSNWIIGTGLGLSVTRLLVEKMGGTISVKSRLNEGSEFTVEIPYAPYFGTAKTKPGSNDTTPKLPNNLKIIVADDNYLNISLLKSIFEKTGATVDVAENGQIAFEKLTTNQYDVLLSDLYMPVMNGIELAKKIRSHSSPSIKNIPIIILSGNISPEVTKEVMEAGISGYLLKPYQQNDLFGLIVKQLK
jgi:signal transduction histidine kinase/CheY-like chemotaxis protein